jgi:hypothetical protein
MDSTGSGQGPVAGCCECGDKPSGSFATELVSYIEIYLSYKTSENSIVIKTRKTLTATNWS